MGKPADIELEIQQLLRSLPALDAVADALTKKFNWAELSLAEVETLSKFLLRCGFFATLANTLTKTLETGPTPWPLYVEALLQATTALEPEVKAALLHRAEDQGQLAELARSHRLDHLDPRLPHLRKQRSARLKAEAQQKRDEWISQLEVFRSQGLLEKEQETLKKLARYFPGDRDVSQALTILRERRAMEALNRNSDTMVRKKRPIRTQPIDQQEQKILDAIETSMDEALGQSPSLAYDFSIAHLMWENYQASQSFLSKAPDNSARAWLRVHLLLARRHFVEVLEELPRLELQDAADPEATFKGLYLRAQALWGLEQKFSAIELLEVLLASRPDFQSGAALLATWKEELD